MNNSETNDLIGCCGLYCGLCSKYQSKAPSRCIGCGSGEQHSWCSIWNCCVKKHGFENCAECGSVFGCEIFLRRRVADWIPAVRNLRRIREYGLEDLLREQRERQALLEELLRDYNEGRSMSFYCKACARMPIGSIGKAIAEAKERIADKGTDGSDLRSKARILKATIKDLALEGNIDLG
jgi:hypothetical protein